MHCIVVGEGGIKKKKKDANDSLNHAGNRLCSSRQFLILEKEYTRSTYRKQVDNKISNVSIQYFRLEPKRFS